jgi:hypothetical protein
VTCIWCDATVSSTDLHSVVIQRGGPRSVV